jgi:hypothetical protein
LIIKGDMMDTKQLKKLLSRYPTALEVVVVGRRTPSISMSVPEGATPKGWRRLNENPAQQIPGYMRICIGGWKNPIKL